MKVAIRLDDITLKMDWEKFLRMKKLLDNAGIKPLIGVIPDNTDPAFSYDENAAVKAMSGLKDVEKSPEEVFFDYIKDLKSSGWTIAMHGLNHRYITSKGGLFPLNDFSEFAGLPYEEQLEALEYGKQILIRYGIETFLFMAPAHSYDINTLKALKALEFTSVTDGFGNRPYQSYGLTFYPISFKKSHVIKKLDSAGVDTSKPEEYTTLVFHTDTMKDKDFDELEKMLDKYKGSFISFDEYLNVSPLTRSAMGQIKEKLMAKSKFVLTRILAGR